MIITDNLKLKLISLIDKQLVSLLIANGYITHLGGEIDWNNIIVKDETLELLNLVEKKDNNYKEIIKSLMEIFPKNQLDSENALLKRYESYLKKTELKNITDDEILDAATDWVTNKGPIYCGNLFYFFYKEDKKIYTSRLDNLITQNREKIMNTEKAVKKEFNINWDKVKL